MIALHIGISIFRTDRPSSSMISALTDTDGIVLFAISAIAPTGSCLFLPTPVISPSSSTPRYKSPPCVFAIPTISSTRSASLYPERSLLNSIVSDSFSGIVLITCTSKHTITYSVCLISKKKRTRVFLFVLVSTSRACYITISVRHHRPLTWSFLQSAPAETEETKPAS